MMPRYYRALMLVGETAMSHSHISRSYYDANGTYRGYVNAEGHHWGKDGRYLGRVAQNGDYWCQDGRFGGHVDPDGQHYDAFGTYCGRIIAATAGSSSNP
ncbi:MAG: hypothetical protein ACE5I7_12765 [Candidatus Binatia bacterium]